MRRSAFLLSVCLKVESFSYSFVRLSEHALKIVYSNELVCLCDGQSMALMLLHFITYVMQQPFENYSGLLLVTIFIQSTTTNKSPE